MKLNSVILADDSESCDIAELFVMMKNSTIQLLEQYTVAHEDIVSVNNTYLSDSITKQIFQKMSLVNSEPFCASGMVMVRRTVSELLMKMW